MIQTESYEFNLGIKMCYENSTNQGNFDECPVYLFPKFFYDFRVCSKPG